jgi:hypothetical protein
MTLTISNITAQAEKEKTSAALSSVKDVQEMSCTAADTVCSAAPKMDGSVHAEPFHKQNPSPQADQQ